MGSSIESTIVMAVIIFVLTYVITAPVGIISECIDVEKEYYDRVEVYSTNEVILSNNDFISTSAEKLCTTLSGLSDSYQIIYNGLVESVFSSSKGDD